MRKTICNFLIATLSFFAIQARAEVYTNCFDVVEYGEDFRHLQCNIEGLTALEFSVDSWSQNDWKVIDHSGDAPAVLAVVNDGDSVGHAKYKGKYESVTGNAQPFMFAFRADISFTEGVKEYHGWMALGNVGGKLVILSSEMDVRANDLRVGETLQDIKAQSAAVLDGCTYCESLESAILGLTNKTQTITLLNDITSTAVTVYNDSVVTLDLNGHKITKGKQEENSLFTILGTMFVIDKKGGGAIEGSAFSDCCGGAFFVSGKLELDGVEVSQFDARVGGCAYVLDNGQLTLETNTVIRECSATQVGGALTIRGRCDFNGGEIRSCTSQMEGGGIRIENVGEIHMAGGLVTGCAGIGGGGVFNKGSFVMSGGELSGNTAVRSNYPDVIIIGHDLFMEKGDVEVSISGGKVKSEIGFHSSYVSTYSGKTKISGGLFGAQPVSEFLSADRMVESVTDLELIADGWLYQVVVTKPDGGPYKATIGDVEWTYGVKDGLTCIGYGWQYQAVSSDVADEIMIPTALGGHKVSQLSVGAFFKCTKMTAVEIPNSVTSLEEGAFEHCTGLSSVKLPMGLICIGDFCFHGCENLEEMTIPTSVISIGECAFQECTKLSTIQLSTNLQSIGAYSFKDCGGLTNLTIPASVTYIGNNAFYGCSSLNALDFEGAPPEGVANVCINKDAVIRYNVAYRDDWLPVIEQCGWTNAKPYLFPTIVSVTAQQNYSTNGAVDIVVTIQGDEKTISKTECLFAVTNSSTLTAVPVATICQVGYDKFSDGICTRHYAWDAKTDIGSVKIDGLVLTVILRESQVDGVQLWENGPYWDECNVGATTPEEYGYYFWWGDTIGYKRNANDDGWVSVNNGAEFTFTQENCPTWEKNSLQLQSAGYIDSTGNLVAAHDAATAHLGEPWRLPTDAEISSLISNCTTTWATRNGVHGYLVTGKGDYATKSIFFPAAGLGLGADLCYTEEGYYWSSPPYSDDSYSDWYAYDIYFSSDEFIRYVSRRYYGRSVRPVRDTAAVFANATIHIDIDCSGIPGLGEHPTIDEITNVFNDANAEDPKLAQKITNETEYVAFREWSVKVKPHGGNEPIGAAGVLAAPNAWLSYALGSDSLIDAVPTNGQMRVEKFEPTSTAGSFDFTVAIDDIAVGSEATKENLKKVFGLEGGATLDALSSTNIDISFGTPENGKVKFTAGPNAKNADAKTFFMKVKMTP